MHQVKTHSITFERKADSSQKNHFLSRFATSKKIVIKIVTTNLNLYQKKTDHNNMNYLLVCCCLFIFGCSMDASLESIVPTHLDSPARNKLSDSSAFAMGEVITTADGTVIMGSFGEISEKTILVDGTEVHGAFYE